MSVNSFGSKVQLDVNGTSYDYFDITKIDGAADLPYSLKVLLENLLRTEDGANITAEDIVALASWDPSAEPSKEIQFTPARVIMQDLTGVPCVVDLATMRDAMKDLGKDPDKINPLSPAEMVIDHSVIADVFGTEDAFRKNVEIEFERNAERYQFLRWGQNAIDNFAIVPPDQGIVHQVNIENLARVVFDNEGMAYCDSCVGTDSHTTMVNGLGVLGWGVGGIEAEAAMLGQPISMLIPRVVGFKLTGKMNEGCTATDLALAITELLRQHKVVGKFVEFYGEGVSQLPLANRATIGNMSPEYGSTCAIFPIDERTIEFLRLTGRDEQHVALVEAYAKAQGLWLDPAAEPRYSERLELDLGTVVPALAGPKRPQDRIKLTDSKKQFQADIKNYTDNPGLTVPVKLASGTEFEFGHGKVGVAAITSCTNTSNPSVMLGAGLVAKKAAELGLTRKPWVKTTLGPGSKVAAEYLEKAGLMSYLEQIDFNVVGYGCTICIGNTGPLIPEVSAAINENNLAATAVLSGNRNFEGRISPDIKMNYLASPMLVIVYAIAGTMDIDLFNDPIGKGKDGQDVFMKDIWPTQAEIDEAEKMAVTQDLYTKVYADIFAGGEEWQNLPTPEGETFTWNEDSTYVRRAPYFDGMPLEPTPVADITGARALLKLGDSVTTDHISPASSIPADSPAAKYLTERGVEKKDFNSYGSRRGNHEVMVRGTFGNIRLRNQLAPGTEGGYTRDFTQTDAPVTTVYDASVNYQAAGIPLVVLGGKEYGTGSSRDWAAKGTVLLGVKAVITESFERIHRSNLIGMGVLPLQFPEGQSADSLGLTGEETFDISGITELNEGRTPKTVKVTATKADGTTMEFDAVVRIDTPGEADYYRNGGILQYVLRNLANK